MLPVRLQHLSFAIPGNRCRAENCKWKHPHKRFCPRQHDTSMEGRTSSGRCHKCVVAWQAARYATAEWREYHLRKERERYRGSPRVRALQKNGSGLRRIRKRKARKIEQIAHLEELLRKGTA